MIPINNFIQFLDRKAVPYNIQNDRLIIKDKLDIHGYNQPVFPDYIDYIKGYVDISNSELITLKHIPIHVKSLYVSETNITDLKYMPQYIDNILVLSSTNIKSLKHIGTVGNYINVSNCRKLYDISDFNSGNITFHRTPYEYLIKFINTDTISLFTDMKVTTGNILNISRFKEYLSITGHDYSDIINQEHIFELWKLNYD